MRLDYFWRKVIFTGIVFSLGLSACTSGLPTVETGPVLPTDLPASTESAPASEAIPASTEPAVEGEPTPAALGMVAASRQPVTGVEMHRLAPEAGLDLVREAGVYWVRYNSLSWAKIEKQEGMYSWSEVASLEEQLKAASAAGVEIILIVRDTPDWAQLQPGSACGPMTPEKIPAFAAFLREAVARYSAPPYNVRYWEIGNEPDVPVGAVAQDSPFGCWGDPADPTYGGGYYASVLRAATPKMKAANPDIQVLLGGLLLDCDPVSPPESPPGSGQYKDCTASTFLEGVLQNGGGDFFDAVSFHAYDYYLGERNVYGNLNWRSSWDTTGPVLAAKTRYLRSLLIGYGYPDKYLLNTEVAILCGRDGKEESCQKEDFQLTKAHYLAQANAMALAEGLAANVWYSTAGWRGSGLFSSELQPYPVYNALKVSSAELNGAAYSQDLSLPGIMGYEFIRAGRRLWVVWSLQHEGATLQLPSQPDLIYDTFGQPVELSTSLLVMPAPLYIEWEQAP